MIKKIILAGFLGIFLISLAQAALTDDLYFYHDFQNETDKVDGIYNISGNGTASLISDNSLIGNSSNLSAGNFYNVTNSGSLQFNTNNFTVAMWVFIRNDTGEQFILDKHEDGGPTNGWFFSRGVTDKLRWDSDGAGGDVISDNDLPSDSWQFISMVANSTNLCLYINATLDKCSSRITLLDTTQPIQIGDYKEKGMDGQLDELGIWNRSLTDDELVNLYNNGLGRTYPFSNSIIVELNSPVDNANVGNVSSIDFNATLTPSAVNLTNATILIYNETDLFNSTTNIVTGSTVNTTSFTILDFDFGTYKWNVLGCGNSSSTGEGVCFLASNNFTFQAQQFNVDAEHFDLEVRDTDNSTFILNITVDAGADLFSATLIYNNTAFVSDDIQNIGGGSYNIKKTIDIPMLSSATNLSFSWNVTLDSGGGFNIQSTTTQSHFVNTTNFTVTGPRVAINYTIFDEVSLDPIGVMFDGTFEWYLGGGSETKTNAFKSSGESIKFYTDPDDEIFYVSSKIRIENQTDVNQSYVPRIYDFNKELLNGTTTEKELFLLNSSTGRDIVIEVKDSALSPLPDLIVTIRRFYPSENKYRIVENQQTNIFGQISARLIENNVKYRFEFRDLNNTLLKETEDLTVSSCPTSGRCIIPIVIKDTEDDFARFSDVPNHACSLLFNNNTRKFTLTWNDNTGDSAVHRLKVEQLAINGTTLVFNDTSNSLVSSLSYTAPDTILSYRAQAFRRVTNERRLICTGALNGVLNVKVGDEVGVFGLEGLMWSFILLFTLVLFGLWSPVVGASLYLIGVIFLGVTQIVYINPAIIISQIVIGVLLIWALRQ